MRRLLAVSMAAVCCCAADELTPGSLMPVSLTPESLAPEGIVWRNPANESQVVRLMTRTGDARSVIYDRACAQEGVAGKWNGIFDAFEENRPAFERLGLREGARVIAEARAREDGDYSVLDENLRFFRSRGYDTVLLAFYDGDEPGRIGELAARISGAGFRVWMAFSGGDQLSEGVLCDPDWLAEAVSAVAAHSEAMLLGWRRSSVHLYFQDEAFTSYLIGCARNANPSIAVVGEAYWGHTAKTGNSGACFSVNSPSCSSACLVFGVYGFAKSNFRRSKGFLDGAGIPEPRLSVVMGDRPYYLTAAKNGRGFVENQLVKEHVEDLAVENGFYGTITIFNDGSDGMFDPSITDNLSVTPADVPEDYYKE